MDILLDKYSFILAIINLLVLYFILRKIFFNKITKFMDERSKKIKNTMTEADNLKSESEKIKIEYESHLNQALKESIDIIQDAKNRAEKEYQEILKSAKFEAEKIVEKAHIETKHERDQMISEVKNYVTELTIKTASKLISSNMDTTKNKNLVSKFIEEDGGIDATS
ncbi:MAG: F0F1 ATP synthase subunit B [Clostridiales bacterium]